METLIYNYSQVPMEKFLHNSTFNHDKEKSFRKLMGLTFENKALKPTLAKSTKRLQYEQILLYNKNNRQRSQRL